MRHFVTRLNWMISKVEDGIVQLIHMPGIDMPADTLTKPQPAPLFLKNRDRIFNAKTASAAPPDAVSSFSASAVCHVPIPPLRPSLSTPASKSLRRAIYNRILQQRLFNQHYHERTQSMDDFESRKWTKFNHKTFKTIVYHINDPPSCLFTP